MLMQGKETWKNFSKSKKVEKFLSQKKLGKNC